MPRPTEPVKRVCYADDQTVCDTGVKVLDLEDSINNYIGGITAYLKDKKREFNGTSTHLLDGYNSANQRFFLHS